MLSEGDVVLGRLVIEGGLATPQQVKAAARDIGRELAAGKTPRGLGELLVERNVLDHERLFHLADRVGQSEGNALRLSRMALEDSLLSRLVSARNICDLELLRAAFHERNALEREGDFVTLGNLLLKKRAINPKQYSDLRAHVRSWIRSCKSCGALSAVDPKKGVATCSHCDQVLPRSVTVMGPIRLPGSGGVAESGVVRVAGAPESNRVTAQVMLRGLTLDEERRRETETIGPYEVVGCVGKGNMGIVYHARHVDTGQDVALKVLTTDAADSTAAQRFEWEARSVSKLDHPHIIKVYGTGIHQQTGRPYMAMELIDGESLEGAIRARDLDLRTAVKVMAQAARAVQAAHESGIIHRDLKPANVLLTADRDAKLGDFGIARDEERDVQLTVDGTAMGTPHYMAPEQLGGKKDQIGKHSDIYSLGAMLYEAVAGRVPFAGATSPGDLFHKIITEAPLPPSRTNPDVPKEIDQLCMRSLSKVADERPPSAAYFAKTLERVLASIDGAATTLDASAPPPPPVSSPSRFPPPVVATTPVDAPTVLEGSPAPVAIGAGASAPVPIAADDATRSSRRQRVPTELQRFAADPAAIAVGSEDATERVAASVAPSVAVATAPRPGETADPDGEEEPEGYTGATVEVDMRPALERRPALEEDEREGGVSRVVFIVVGLIVAVLVAIATALVIVALRWSPGA